MPISDLYALPSDAKRAFTTLPSDAIITGLLLPRLGASARSIYRIAMPRAAWSFALAGAAIGLVIHEGTVVEARIALSGVAPIPIRAISTERLLSGRRLDDLDLKSLSEDLTATAAPLNMNGYKVTLLQGIFRQAFSELLARSV